jgi:hypothetical protein
MVAIGCSRSFHWNLRVAGIYNAVLNCIDVQLSRTHEAVNLQEPARNFVSEEKTLAVKTIVLLKGRDMVFVV